MDVLNALNISKDDKYGRLEMVMALRRDKTLSIISPVWCGTAVSPVHQRWRCCSLALDCRWVPLFAMSTSVLDIFAVFFINVCLLGDNCFCCHKDCITRHVYVKCHEYIQRWEVLWTGGGHATNERWNLTYYFFGQVRDCCLSSALAMETLQPCIQLPMYASLLTCPSLR